MEPKPESIAKLTTRLALFPLNSADYYQCAEDIQRAMQLKIKEKDKKDPAPKKHTVCQDCGSLNCKRVPIEEEEQQE
jgi:hypothetical protein